MKKLIKKIMEKILELIQKAKEALTNLEVEIMNPTPVEPTIEMKFKKGDVITWEGIERVILEVYNGYYIWGYEYAPDKSWDSRNSSDPLLESWELKPEIIKNIIAEFEPYTGTPMIIPATEDTSFVDEEGNTVPFTIRIPLLINENDTGFIISKSDRALGDEWSLRVFKDDLQFIISRSSDKRDKTRINIPLNKLPKELFDLVITIDFTGDNRKVEFYINARRVVFNLGANSFTKFEKTNAPIRVGGNGWNDNTFTGEVGKTTIEKGRIWKVDEVIEAYQDLFKITNFFIEPSEDGKVHIPVAPNTGQEVGFELLEAFRRVRNGSDVVMEEGMYLVDLDLDAKEQQSAIEFYGKQNISLDGKGAILYTTRMGVTDLFKEGNSKRLQVNVMDSENISIRNLNVESSFDEDASYMWSVAFEHAFSNTYSKNIKYENINVKNVGGDGLYFKYCDNVSLKNIVTDGTNRMGIGISHACYNFKIDGYEAYNCQRASIDLEGDGTYYVIDGIEITNCYLTTYIAAGGNSRINNVNIHHNRWVKDIIMKGNRWTDNPDYDSSLPISDENPKNLDLEPRENWVIEDNEKIGNFGTPMSMVRIRYCKNVKVNRNNIHVSKSQGRSGIALDFCLGNIEIEGNTYPYPLINRIQKSEVGTEVIIDELNNDNVYAIEIEGKPLKVIGENIELLAKMFSRNLEFANGLLLGEVEVIEESFIKYPELLKNIEIPDWDFTLGVSEVAKIASKDMHILYYFFVAEEETMRFILENHSELLDKLRN